MDLQPDIKKLMRREIYTLLTITTVILIIFSTIQVLVVTLNPDAHHVEFIRYGWPWVGGGLLALWLITPGLLYLWIKNLKYLIEDERLVIHKGIITKKNVSIPYSAVTDFTLSRSLYERWLGIGTILIQTAGQSTQPSGYEGKLEGLVKFEALHETLRAKIKAFRRGKQEEISPLGSDTSLNDSAVLKSILEEVKRIGKKLD